MLPDCAGGLEGGIVHQRSLHGTKLPQDSGSIREDYAMKCGIGYKRDINHYKTVCLELR